MFDGLLPETLRRSCRPGEYFNLEARFCCRSAADSATSDPAPNLWLWLAATEGAVSICIVATRYPSLL
jgi:hypothetical protein